MDEGVWRRWRDSWNIRRRPVPTVVTATVALGVTFLADQFLWSATQQRFGLALGTAPTPHWLLLSDSVPHHSALAMR